MNNNANNSQSGELHTSQAHSLTGSNESFSESEISGIEYEAYGYSKAGHGVTTNSDNFYCNRAYMKGFKYMDFKKNAYIMEKTSLFAVCTGEGDEDWADETCKLALEMLNEYESDLTETANEKEAIAKVNSFVSACDSFMASQGRQLHMIVALIIPGAMIYASFGKVMLVHKNKKRIIEHPVVTGMLVGSSALPSMPAKSVPYRKGDVFVFCTRGIKSLVSVETLAEELKTEHTGMKDIAVRVIGKAIACGVTESSTCIAVEAKGHENVSMLAYIISILCCIITITDIVLIIRSLFIR